MEFRDFISKKADDTKMFIKEENEETKVYVEKTKSIDEQYFNIVNPETGLRFDIPMVSPVDPNYFFQYIYYMKLRERSPETFQNILNWE